MTITKNKFKNVESPNNINLLNQRQILEHRITRIYLSCNSMNQYQSNQDKFYIKNQISCFKHKIYYGFFFFLINDFSFNLDKVMHDEVAFFFSFLFYYKSSNLELLQENNDTIIIIIILMTYLSKHFRISIGLDFLFVINIVVILGWRKE